MRWIVGLSALVAGIGTALALRKSKRLGDPFDDDEDDPYAPPPDEPEDEGGCLLVGRWHHKYSSGPYRVCLTHNQEQKLFGGKRRSQKKLGCGVFACAYTIPGSTRVVKFTRDSEDVAALLKAQKTGVVPKIFDVYKLKQSSRTIPKMDPMTFRTPEAQEIPVFALVMERLRTLSTDERMSADEHLPDIRDVAEGKMPGGAYCDSRVDDDGNVGCDDLEMKVISAVEKLRAAGIQWNDIHGGNIGFDSRGKLKVLDLGLTKTELKRRLKILAGLGKPRRISNVSLI